MPTAEEARREAERKRKEEEARREERKSNEDINYEKYSLKKTLKGHSDRVFALAVHKDTIISGSGVMFFGKIKLWSQ